MLIRVIDLVAFVWPIALSLVFLVAGIFPYMILEKTGILRFSMFDFISYKHGVRHGFIRIVFFTVALLLVVSPGFRDYSRSFPDVLKITVFFDDQGIEKLLQSWSPSDLRRLAIEPKWKQQKKAYFANINDQLEKAGVPFRFREVPGQTSATGEVKFKVQMIERWGAQLYQIVEANGSLVHTTEMPGTERYRIVSEFELMKTEGATINGSITDVYLNHGLLIMPEFKQLFRISPSTEIYHHSLITATRFDIFPYLNISNTLYLLREDSGSNVPIGYAINALP